MATGLAILGASQAMATCVVPDQLTNGQTADATQVMANFNATVSCINALVAPTGAPLSGQAVVFSGPTSVTSGPATSFLTQTFSGESATYGISGTFGVPNGGQGFLDDGVYNNVSFSGYASFSTFAKTDGSGISGSLQGAYLFPELTGPGTLAYMYTVYGGANVIGGAVTNLYGISETPTVSAGTVTNLQSFYSQIAVYGTGVITNYYSFLDDVDYAPGGGTVTNEWGFYQKATNHPNQFASSVALPFLTPSDLVGTDSTDHLTSIGIGSGLTLIGGQLSTVGGGGAIAPPPQGRLTLTSGAPVMTSDVTAATTLYYDCHVGNLYPNYNGSTDTSVAISSCEISTALKASGTGVLNSGDVFDVWGITGSVLCIATNGSGGGWSSDTGGSTTARGTGYSKIHNTRGYWTNANSITHCYNGATDKGAISADRATLLGSIYTTAAGQTEFKVGPNAAAGGAGDHVYISNAYNRVRFTALSVDTTGSWTYAGTTWRVSNNNTNNEIPYLDCCGMATVQGDLLEPVSGGATFNNGVGIDWDGCSATPFLTEVSSGSTPANTPITGMKMPAYGRHYLCPVENTNGGTRTFWMSTGNGTASVNAGYVKLQGEY